MKKFLLLAFAINGMVGIWKAGAATWPFDQRQVLLVKNAAKNFPDEVSSAQFLDAFVKRGRVRWVTQKGGTGQVLPLEVPADFDWQSAQAVKNFGLKYKVDGLVYLEQQGVELHLRWYATLDGLPIFIEKVSLPAAANDQDAFERKQRLVNWVNSIWAKIPGLGYVMSRDMRKVRFEGGSSESIQVGDTLELRRVQSVERHPLLKTVVDVKTVLTGLAKVSRLSEPMSEAEIGYESELDPIQEGDRYVLKKEGGAGAPVTVPAALAKGGAVAAVQKKLEDGDRVALPLFGKDEEDQSSFPVVEGPVEDVAESYPKIVDLEALVSYASVSHADTIASTEYQLKKSAPGLELRGRFYLTRNWIISAGWAGQFFSFSQVPASYQSSSLSSKTTDIYFDLGHRFLFMEEQAYPAEITVQLGYRSYKMGMGRSPVTSLAPTEKTFKGLEFVLTGLIPVFNNYGIFAGASRGIGISLTEQPETSGASSSNALWDFRAGLEYRLNKRGKVLGGLRVLQASATFEDSGSRETPSVQTKVQSSGIFAGYAQSF